MAPVFDLSRRLLYVCNRFNNTVGLIDLSKKAQIEQIAVQREPVAAALTQDGRFLLVANHLHTGRADAAYVAATVSVINTETEEVLKDLDLPNGSGALKDIRVSPDGKYAVVCHLVAGFRRKTDQLFYGWMNANALTIIDIPRMEVRNTVLLDNIDSGAANPWATAWSTDGSLLVVAHAGTHEISVIDFPRMIAHVVALPRSTIDRERAVSAFRARPELADDLPFLTGARKRVKLPAGDLGPRAVTVFNQIAYVANYFSDSISVVDLSDPEAKKESISLGVNQRMSKEREGELLFHDGRICFQSWQSCSSCHPGDGRSDALNWDLLNDGVGNAKNTKSLLLAHQTPPAMSLGVRETPELAVRAGIKNILFTQQPEEVAIAIDAYLRSLSPVPSPYLERGRLSASAERGREVYQRAGCSTCHPSGLFTDGHQYDVGTRGPLDNSSDRFDTPTLVELWRTAPYLHNGSAATVREVITTRNVQDRHGKTSQLDNKEVDDLCCYLLSL